MGPAVSTSNSGEGQAVPLTAMLTCGLSVKLDLVRGIRQVDPWQAQVCACVDGAAGYAHMYTHTHVRCRAQSRLLPGEDWGSGI